MLGQTMAMGGNWKRAVHSTFTGALRLDRRQAWSMR